jgi:hypothetical protein
MIGARLFNCKFRIHRNDLKTVTDLLDGRLISEMAAGL